MKRDNFYEDCMPRRVEPRYANISIYETSQGFSISANSNCEYIQGELSLQLINFIRQRCDDWENGYRIRFDKLK